MPKSVGSGKLSFDKAIIWWMLVQAAMGIEEEHMAGLYHHTQPGTLMLTVLSFAALLTGLPGVMAMTLRSGHWPWLLFVPPALCWGLAWLFSSLTVEVSSTGIRWYFGPGLWDYRIALSDIEGVRIVRNTWLNGFGIRMGPGRRLYNVSGFDAVELRLKTGDIRCIGTDDPPRSRLQVRPEPRNCPRGPVAFMMCLRASTAAQSWSEYYDSELRSAVSSNISTPSSRNTRKGRNPAA